MLDGGTGHLPPQRWRRDDVRFGAGLTAKLAVARLFAAAALLALAACASPKPQSEAAHGAPVRIVALVPSLAEDLFAIGAGPQVVGVSQFTENLNEARGLPRVSDFTNVDCEKIVALRADLVLGIPSQARLVEPLRRAGIDVVLIPNDTYGEIFESLRRVGALTGHEREAQAAAAALRKETAALQARTRAFKRHPSVFVVLGDEPVWTVGNRSYIGTLIGMAGGRNAASDLPAAYGQYSSEALLRDDPDVVVVDPAVHLQSSLDREPWRSLRAVRERRVYTIDPPEMLMRPGPNYNKGLLWLIERLAPRATQG
jgi:iron complex transport system substrate-binding protein